MGADTPGTSVVLAWLFTGHGSGGSRNIREHWDGALCLLVGWCCPVGLGSCFCLSREGVCDVPIAPLPPCICPYSTWQLVSPTASLLAAHALPVRVYISVSSPHPKPVDSSVFPPVELSHEWEPSDVLSWGCPPLGVLGEWVP